MSLFDVAGMQVEYVLADQETLKVKPIAEKLLNAFAGTITSQVNISEEISLAKTLVSHVIAIKNNSPPPGLPVAGLPILQDQFGQALQKILAECRNLGVCLLPTGMHPLMNPLHETKLWSDEGSDVYAIYHRMFNCHRHGWSNIQSSHLNIAFNGDSEFTRLHTALRVLLPLLPALAASSPIMDGKISPCLDQRLVVYGQNQSRIPCLTGDVIPESVGSIDEYHEKILQPIARAIRSFDPDGLMKAEQVNSRGAVALFDQSVFEIRLLDTQECVLADCAMAVFIQQLLQKLAEDSWGSFQEQLQFPQVKLKKIYTDSVRRADQTQITDPAYLALFGLKNSPGLSANSLLWNLFHQCVLPDPFVDVMETMLARGSLATRLVHYLGNDPAQDEIKDAYLKLSRCLAEQTLFIP